ncbi:MAG: hypothetical protein WBZ19_25965 [Chthoniobacterales bacterium]
MTPSLNISSIHSMLTVGQPTTIVTKQKESKSVTVARPALRSWRSVWRLTSLFEAFAGILAVSYLFAAITLAGALLFYTFNR